MQEFTTCGGDNGDTDRYIRQACNLPPRDATAATSPMEGLVQPISQEYKEAKIAPTLKKIADHYSTEFFRDPAMHSRGPKALTWSYFLIMKGPNDLPKTMTKKKQWEDLCSSEYFVPLKKTGQYLPRVFLEKDVSVLYPSNEGGDDPVMSFTEMYDVDHFKASLYENIARSMNLSILIRHYEGQGTGKKKPGRKAKVPKAKAQPVGLLTNPSQPCPEELEKLKTLQGHIDSYTHLLLGQKPNTAVDAAAHPTKRRRLSRKMSADNLTSTPPSVFGAASRKTFVRSVTYKRTRPWRSRRYADGEAAQSMQQLMQEATLPHTCDADVKNMKFAIIPQLLSRLGVVDKELWKPELDHLQELAVDRALVCERELGMSESEGKVLIFPYSKSFLRIQM